MVEVHYILISTIYQSYVVISEISSFFRHKSLTFCESFTFLWNCKNKIDLFWRETRSVLFIFAIPHIIVDLMYILVIYTELLIWTGFFFDNFSFQNFDCLEPFLFLTKNCTHLWPDSVQIKSVIKTYKSNSSLVKQK